MTRPNITPWPSFAPQAFQPTEAQKQAIAAVPALLEALEAMLEAYAWNHQKTVNDHGEDSLHSSVKKARSALIAAGYQF